MAWADFKPAFFREWNQGEHVSLIGPTGGGKTTLAREILPRREYVAIIGTKPRDPTLSGFLRSDGFRKLTAWPPSWNQRRVIVWPELRRIPEDIERQQRVFDHMLREIFTARSWCVYIDELAYLCEQLKLERHLAPYWKQGRSINLSLVVATQRPAHVPLDAYTQATHLFFWRTNDERDLKRIGGIGFLDSRVIRDLVAALPWHSVLYVNSRTGAMAVTRVEREAAA